VNLDNETKILLAFRINQYINKYSFAYINEGVFQ